MGSLKDVVGADVIFVVADQTGPLQSLGIEAGLNIQKGAALIAEPVGVSVQERRLRDTVGTGVTTPYFCVGVQT